MESLGTVVEILGPSMVLVQAKWELSNGQVLQVFGEISSNDLILKHGLTSLHIPKGSLRVVAKQNNGFYLAEIFQTYLSAGRLIEKPSSLLSGILGPPEFTRESVKGPLSASLSEPTLPLDLTRKVIVGDQVGTE
jgi:hypothetical protein